MNRIVPGSKLSLAAPHSAPRCSFCAQSSCMFIHSGSLIWAPLVYLSATSDVAVGSAPAVRCGTVSPDGVMYLSAIDEGS